MALTGEDKEMRMPGSLGFDPLENLDHSHHHHIQSQEQLIHQEKTRASHAPGGATTALNSGGSKSKSSPAFGRSNSSTRYRECLKNHAASIGGNVTDGCGEFMPSGEEGTLEAFKCAACHCHRNFHRKEGNGENAIVVHQLQLPPPLPSPSMNQHRGESMNLHGNHWTTMVQPVKMAFGGGGSGSAATDSSSEELNFNAFQSTSVPPPPQFVLAKKRFRTKFSQEQKEKMLAFAEKLGWRIPREDDAEVQRFCAEVGVKRQVFKVWMHNNKNSAKKTPQES